MKLFEKMEFPCGLKVESSARGFGLAGEFHSPQLEIYKNGCPLHGKKCHQEARR